MSLESKSDYLIDRALMLRKVRSFFEERKVIEVDTPLLCEFPNLDKFIEPIVAFDGQKKRFLHTSPEFGMKRLLAAIKQDIYQLSHVFRAKEFGSKHNPEFTMIEWYRIGFSLDDLLNETLELIELFIGSHPIHRMNYQGAFKNFLDFDLEAARKEDFFKVLKAHNIDFSPNLTEEELCDLTFSLCIEPKFQGITILHGFPPSQAALAKVKTIESSPQAMRFEIYYNSFELANGYDELLDPEEQKKRFEEWNEERANYNKDPLIVDDRFLTAIGKMPDCVGVAVGFDRLMMARHKAESISSIIPFAFNEI